MSSRSIHIEALTSGFPCNASATRDELQDRWGVLEQIATDRVQNLKKRGYIQRVPGSDPAAYCMTPAGAKEIGIVIGSAFVMRPAVPIFKRCKARVPRQHPIVAAWGVSV